MTLVAKVENDLVVSVSAYDSAAIDENEFQNYIVLPDYIHLNFQIEDTEDDDCKDTTDEDAEIDKNSLTYQWLRVINCINRVNALTENNAPEIVLKNERNMLQKAVDSLVNS